MLSSAIQKIESDIDATRRSAEALERSINRALTTRDGLQQRMAELEDQVGKAKGRLELKEDVTATLERIQNVMHEATVGSYARLLTALVQDVINKDTIIDIDLTLERGQPAMTVSSYDIDSPSYKSLIYENSGAMTNVVCTGLRIIAVSKSGGRKFLVLDEPDCWIRDSRVERFYEVLRSLCRDIGFQIVVISHHDASKFGSDCRIVNLVAQPKPNNQDTESDVAAGPTRKRGGAPEVKNPRTTIAQIVPFAEGTSWDTLPDDQPGIRDIHIRNLATLENVSIELDPYMTVIAGDVDVGKSRITRAFRAALYGDVSDSDIRHGQTGLSVSMTIENSATMEFTRQMRRNPVNQWVARDQDGNIMTYDGQVCESRGRAMPEWVSGMMGIVRIDDLDLQISHQKKPVFLLDQSPTRQAVVLSVGQEVQWLADMQTTYKQRLSSWNQTIRSGEAEAEKIIAQLQRFYRLDYCAEHVAAMMDYLTKASAIPKSMGSLMQAADELRAMQERAKSGRAVISTLSALPAIPDVSPEMGRDYGEAATRLRALMIDQRNKRRVITALQNLPEAPSLPDNMDNAAHIASDIRHTFSRKEKGAAILARLAGIDTLDVPTLPTSDAASYAGDIRAMSERSDRVRRALGILNRMPASVPSLPPQGDEAAIRQLGENITALRKLSATKRSALASIDAETSEVEASKRAIIEEAGDICPACGHTIDEDHHHAAPDHDDHYEVKPSSARTPALVKAALPIDRDDTALENRDYHRHQAPRPAQGQDALADGGEFVIDFLGG
jgi:energy-coupling factor transporter ATP-binding protein EcfA2